MARIAEMYICYYLIAFCLTAQSFKLSSSGYNSYMLNDCFLKAKNCKHISRFNHSNRFNDTSLYTVVDDNGTSVDQIDSDLENNSKEYNNKINKNNINSNENKIINNINSSIINENNIIEENKIEDIYNVNDSNPIENQLDVEDDEHLSVKKERKLRIDKSVIYTMPSDEYIVVGVIMSTYGLRGHVKVKSFSSQPEVRLCEPGYRYLKIPFNNQRVVPVKLERGKCSGNKDIYIVKFEGFDDVAQAQRLSRAQITIPLVEAPPLEEDTYYSRDIVGLNMYLYNDVSKTKLGSVVGFIHRSDLASRKKYEDICEDLIEVQMDMNLSLKTLIDVANASRLKKESEENEQENTKENKIINNNIINENKIKEKNKGPTIVTERELYDADDLVDMYEEFERPFFKSMLYLKYYECSICGKEFTNHTIALKHERMHEEMGDNYKDSEGLFSRWEEDDEEDEDDLENNNNKENNNNNNKQENKENKEEEKPIVVSIEDILNTETAKPIRRFYVPLVRNETVKYIDVQNKSIYVDPYTIFIGEDNKRKVK